MPAADVKFVTQGADIDRYKSLVAGITDAAMVSNEFEAVMPPNIHVLMKATTAVPKFIRLCVATNKDVLANRRADLVKFVAAEMDAYKFALDHRDEAVKVAREMTHAKPDDKRAEFIVDQARQGEAGRSDAGDPGRPHRVDAAAVRQGRRHQGGGAGRHADRHQRARRRGQAGGQMTQRVAEGVGFEPTLRFPVNTLSKRAPSATRPPLLTQSTRASSYMKTRALRLRLRQLRAVLSEHAQPRVRHRSIGHGYGR